MIQKVVSHWVLFLAALLLVVAPACQSKKAQQGAVIGAAAGGAAGGLLGKEKGKTALGFIIGAAVGGAAGAAIGKYMDKQASEIENDLEGAEVERVGEGILITFDSGLLFEYDSYALNSTTKQNLRELAATMQKYGDTEVLIEGHTDNKGSESYNQTLSERRAQSVADYLASQGVGRNRLVTKGYGEMQPVSTNETDAGRQENRRVEVAIVANKDLQKQAEKGTLTVN